MSTVFFEIKVVSMTMLERELHESGKDLELMRKTYQQVFLPFSEFRLDGSNFIYLPRLHFVRYGGEDDELRLDLTHVYKEGRLPQWHVDIYRTKYATWAQQPRQILSDLDAVYEYCWQLDINKYIPVVVRGERRIPEKNAPQFLPLILERAMRRVVDDKLQVVRSVECMLRENSSKIRSLVAFPKYANPRST